MTLSQLDEKLSNACDAFKYQIQSTYDAESNTPVSEADLHELGRQTFYTLDTFRIEIIKYLQEHS